MSNQDYANEKCVCLVIKGGTLTARALAFAMRAFLAEVPKQMRQPSKQGKQSVKSLAKGGAKLENMEVGNECIKQFERTAAKYAVDYAVMKDCSEEPPKSLVFFKSRDAASMDAAFREFSAKQLCKSATKPTLRETLSQMMQKAREQKQEQTREQNQERETVR